MNEKIMGFVVSEFFSSHPILSPILSVLLVVSLLSLLNRIGLFQPLVSFVLRSLVALRDAIVSVSRFLWRALANGWFVLVESVFSPLLVHFLRPIAVTARRCLSTFLELVLTAVVLMARAAKASWTFLTLYIGRLFRWMYLNAISPAARMIRAVAFMIRDFTALAYRKLVVPSGNALSNLGSFCYNRGVLPVAYGCLYVYRHVIIASFLAVGRFLKWFYLRVVVPCALILWEALCTGWRYFRSGSTKAAYGVGKFLKWFYLRVVVPCARIIWEALCTGWQYFWNGSVKAAYSAGSALASAYRFSKRIFFELVALARKFYVRVLRPVLHLLDYVVVSPTAHFVDYVFVAPTFYVLRNYVSPFFRWIFRNLVVPVVFLVWEALAAAPMLSFRCFGLWLVATSSVDVELISIRQIGKNVLMSSLGFWIAGSSFRSGAGTRLAMYVLVQAVLSRSPFVSTAFIFLFVVVVNFSTRSSTYNPSRVSFAYLLLYHGVLFAANTRSMFHVLAAYSCVVVACSVAVFPPPFLARKLFFFLDFGIVSFFVDRSTGGSFFHSVFLFLFIFALFLLSFFPQRIFSLAVTKAFSNALVDVPYGNPAQNDFWPILSDGFENGFVGLAIPTFGCHFCDWSRDHGRIS